MPNLQQIDFLLPAAFSLYGPTSFLICRVRGRCFWRF